MILVTQLRAGCCGGLIVNKTIEKFHFEEFLKCINESNRNYTSCESPDFLLKQGKETIGYEITRLKQKILSPVAGTAKKIVQAACKKAIENNIAPLDIHVFMFIDQIKLSRKFINECSNYIYDIVITSIDLIEKANGNVIKLDTTNNKYSINQITAHWNSRNGIKWLDNHRWWNSEPGFVNTKFYDVIQNAIDDKNKKYNRYLDKCDKCNLIIVVDRTKYDEHFDITYMDEKYIYDACFEKVYFFDIIEKTVCKLSIEKST